MHGTAQIPDIAEMEDIKGTDPLNIGT